MKYFKNYQNVTQRHHVSKGCYKNGTHRLAGLRAATILNLPKKAISMKHNKAKYNKMRYACKYFPFFTTTHLGKYHYLPCFADEETNVPRLIKRLVQHEDKNQTESIWLWSACF